MQPGSGRGTGTERFLLRLPGYGTPIDALEAATLAAEIGATITRYRLLDGVDRPTDIRLDPPLHARVS
jgi:hypothetical protein